MAYTFDALFAVDPNSPNNIARNASILLFDPNDPAKTPVTLTDVTDVPVPNPIQVNQHGFGPAIKHPTLDRLAWEGAGMSGVFTSYEGLKEEAVAARVAAEDAFGYAVEAAGEAVAAATVNPAGDLILTRSNGEMANAGSVRGPKGDQGEKGLDGSNVLPTDAAIKQAITTPGTDTATALNATIVAESAPAADKAARKVTNALSVMPRFVRANGGNPVFTQAAQNPASGALAPTTASSIYWPCIVRASDFGIPSPLDAYYMFYSTDHQVGGVWLATGPTPLGPWTGRGQVYNDTGGGEQTETAEVFMNPKYGEAGEKRFLMLYQQKDAPGAVGAQSTMWAASDNMLSWTRGAIALDITPSVPGDGHTGYARVHQFGNQLFAHHLRGGGDFAHFGLSVSSDGKKWSCVSQLGWGQDQTGDGRRIEWNYTSLVRWRGQILWIGLISQVVSGTATNDARIGIAPITPDLRNLVGKPQYILYPTVGAETTSYRGIHAYQFDGTIYLYYQVGNSFYAAIAED